MCDGKRNFLFRFTRCQANNLYQSLRKENDILVIIFVTFEQGQICSYHVFILAAKSLQIFLQVQIFIHLGKIKNVLLIIRSVFQKKKKKMTDVKLLWQQVLTCTR
jgi:hypothetical protein